ncbi:hypothetical protein [Streptomyces odonnellii]|uniref:hypothetical protein n=1 Tax=Streptomyces odonnellii TaxID=1417980 RepID=UPI0006261256|nr:hypothetical protein [Streptomyces odonnellii]
MAETIYVRGEGGMVFAMDLPLPESIAERLERGQLVRVNADGSPYYGAPAPAQGSALTEGIVPRPGARAGKDDWVLWAMAVHALPEDTAQGLTKAQLQELPEQPGQSPSVAAGRPAEDATKAEWIAHLVSQGRVSAEDAANYTKADLIDMVS